MKVIREILRGLLIGAAGIMPGISGGTLAVSMGVYDTIIKAISGLFRQPAPSVRILMPYGLGMLAGIGGLALVIEGLFLRYPLATSLAFLGLILGGIPAVWKRADFKQNGMQKYMIFIVTFCLMIVLLVMEGSNEAGESVMVFGSSGERLLVMTCVGLIASVTMVVPGVSGTMLLTMMGYYQPVLHAFNQVQKGAFAGNWQLVMEQQEILMPFMVGLVVGVFLCAKTMEVLIRRYGPMVYAAVAGLVVSSPVVVLWSVPVGAAGTAERAAGVGLLAVGIWLVYQTGEEISES